MRMRLDNALVERGLVHSRSRAHDLIKRGVVQVDGRAVTKAGELVSALAAIDLPVELAAQASRAAGKLEAGLEAFGFAVAVRVALDIGASTGGFTQVLLERGAATVYAVDVGHDQLAEALRTDPRVVVLEGVDARALTRALVPEPITAIVADVSFISLRSVLEKPVALAAPGCWLIALVKPQFELGRKAIGKNGVVRDRQAAEAAAGPIAAWLEAAGWRVCGIRPSPLPGKAGNREWLIGATRDG